MIDFIRDECSKGLQVKLGKREPELGRGFTQVPNAILDTQSLSHYAKLVYWSLYSHCRPESGKWDCWPSLKTIGRQIGASAPTVIDALKELKGRGLVSWKSGRKGGVNRYTVRRFEDSKLKDKLLLAKPEENEDVEG